MNKLSLKAKNPFGSDIELVSGKTWIGIGAAAVLVASFAAMYGWAKSKTKTVTSPIDDLHARLRKVGS